MNKVFTEKAWADYACWQSEDRRTLKRINRLIEDIERNGNQGLGKPEPLVGRLSGFWSRRINDRDRLIYRCEGEDIFIIACRYHYDDH
ncbi:MAG: Txe/YoeB family addiction module toxin [Erysipelotrichaceae bacterium]|nr:Txe/YoeB family addiction module toxin [Erysipelotrichaceae bacterium]MBR5049107.1 Txe/YoeB family addiction module toxin [Erysipelotrichaceae bacterium]